MKNVKFCRFILIILTSVLLINCSSDDSKPPETSFNSDDYIYYVSGTINGDDFIYGLRKDAVELEFGANYGREGTCNIGNKDYAGLSYNAGIYPEDDNTLSALTLEFIRFYLCSNVPSQGELFNDLFPVKAYEYGTNNSVVSGDSGLVAVHYMPNVENDVAYASLDGDQTGNHFEITSSINENIYSGSNPIALIQLVEGNFKVKLYSEVDVNDVIEITNGSFKLSLSY